MSKAIPNLTALINSKGYVKPITQLYNTSQATHKINKFYIKGYKFIKPTGEIKVS